MVSRFLCILYSRMKKSYLGILLSINIVSTLCTKAQDVIVKNDGSTILTKVVEVNPTNIKYKKHSNLNGPIYTLNIEEVLSVNYENGEKEYYGNNNGKGDASSEKNSNYIQKNGDARNVELISLYNKHYDSVESPSKRGGANRYILIFGMKNTSVISNEDIEISFLRKKTTITNFEVERITYNINIKNKTNKTIYIDKGNCFKIFDDGNSYCYYESTEHVTISSSQGQGGSIGLGGITGALGIGGAIGQISSGISIGGGSSSSVSTTYSEQRIVAIPPFGNRNLREEKIVTVNEAKFMKDSNQKLFNKAEVFDFVELGKSIIENPGGGSKVCVGKEDYPKLNLKKGLVGVGDVLNYDENTTPCSISYYITYSTKSDFETYSSVRFDVYLREVIGCGKYRKNNIFSGCSRILSDEYIKGINEYTIEGYYEAE